VLVDSVVTVANDGAVDVCRDNEDQRVGRLPERFFDGGLEQPAAGDRHDHERLVRALQLRRQELQLAGRTFTECE